MSCDWEGNRRSGVALALRHRLEWFIHLRAHGLSKGDEHPTNTPREVWHSLPFFCSHESLHGGNRMHVHCITNVSATSEACSYVNDLNTAIDDHHVTVHIAVCFKKNCRDKTRDIENVHIFDIFRYFMVIFDSTSQK